MSVILPYTHPKVDSNVISPSTSVKNLGIHFDNHLLFDTRITKITRKVFATILFINRLKAHFATPTIIIVVQSLVMRILTCGISIWGATNITQNQRIQKLQNFAAKVALGGAAKSEHAAPFLRELKWHKIKQQYEFNIASFTCRLMKEDLPSWLLPVARVGDRQSHSGVNTR